MRKNPVKTKPVLSALLARLGVVFALVGSNFSFGTAPASATPTTCYVVENGELTNGSACSGDVVIDSSVTSIGQHSGGYGAFQGTSITSVTIPASVTEIKYGAFWETPLLSSVVFAPESTLARISNFAFATTPSLKGITLPSSLLDISSVAFAYSGVRYIVFEGAPPTIINYNGPGDLQGVSLTATAWVTRGNFTAFSSQSPTILPNVRSFTGNAIFSPSDGETLTATVGAPFIQDIGFYRSGNPTLQVSSGSLPPGITLNESGQLVGTPTTIAPFVIRNYPLSLTLIDGTDSATVAINFEIFPRQQDLFRNWQTPLAAISNGGPKVGDTVHASAFERVLPRSLFKADDINGFWQTDLISYPNPEEYVYRITKEENSPASSVDHQSQTGYESLTSAEQDQWYVDSGFDINNLYRFKWFAFMCVAPVGGSYTLTKPSQLNTSYASREDGILLDGTLNPAHNLMFKDAAEDWMDYAYQGQTLRSVVGSKVNDGPYTDAFLGDQEMPWRTIVYGILDVSASCGAGQTLQALTIVDSNNSAITSKSFEITEQLKLEISGDYFLVETAGTSIGVTGGGLPPGFNAALWGLTTVAGNTPPPPPQAPPAPPQQSQVSGVSVEFVRADSSAIIMVKGTFVENIVNISLNGNWLKPSDWLQSANLVSITLPAGSAGKNLIQIYNGSAPLLPVQSVEVFLPTPSEKVSNPPTPAVANPPTPEATPTPTPTRKAQVLKVGTIFNATASYFVSNSSMISIKTIASKIRASNVTVVYVDGHADSRGGTNNVKLSQQRAKVVASILRPLVAGKKIVIRWYGSSKPIATGNSATDLAKNRRVEIYAK